MLSTEELQAIKERCEKATLGDWGFVPIENHVEYFIFGEGGNEAVAEAVYTKEDAEFISHSRQDIPKLLAEIERLRTGIDRALYDLTNEDYTDPYAVEKIADELREVIRNES